MRSADFHHLISYLLWSSNKTSSIFNLVLKALFMRVCVGLVCPISWLEADFAAAQSRQKKEVWEWKCSLLHRSVDHGPFLVLSDLHKPGKIPMATSQWPGLASSTTTLILFLHKEHTLAIWAFPGDMEFYWVELQQCDLLRERPRSGRRKEKGWENLPHWGPLSCPYHFASIGSCCKALGKVSGRADRHDLRLARAVQTLKLAPWAEGMYSPLHCLQWQVWKFFSSSLKRVRGIWPAKNKW